MAKKKVSRPAPLAPGTNVTVDFETFYDAECTLKLLGYHAYCRHEKWEAYMVSIVGPGIEFVGRPEDAPWELIDGCYWWSWNSAFDSEVYARLKELKPRIFAATAREWNCSSSMACYFGAPRTLSFAVKHVLKEEMSKDMRKWAKGKTGDDIRAAGRWDEMCAYCLVDSKQAHRFVDLYLELWPAHERRLSLLNYTRAAAGFCVDRDRVDGYVGQLEELMWRCRKSIPWAKDLPTNEGVLSTSALALQCRTESIPVPESTSEDDSRCRLWEMKYGAKFPWVAAMREFRKANIMLKRLKTMQVRTMANGRVPYGSKYFGTHTGRPSGDAGLNIYNQPKDPFVSALMPELRVDIRGCIVAAPGKRILTSDKSQIEPRLVYWFGEQWDTLDRIARGESVYEIHGRSTMGWTDPRSMKEADPNGLYFLAKQRVLALGFGCGWERFRDRCLELGFDITDFVAQKQVADFREKQPWLAGQNGLWKQMEKELRRGAKDPSKRLEIELPSGRLQRYMSIQNRGGSYAARVEIGGTHRKCYGGLLFENLVSATAREAFVEDILALEDIGTQVMFQVYDEIVGEVDADRADETKAEAERIMSRTPEWAPGLPLACEAKLADRYTK